MTSEAIMDSSTLEKECSGMGGLFQQIITDLKMGTPIWEDLISKATKLHTCLRATIHALATFLDAFQKIADDATNTRGATKDIGTALTRICLRQKAVEARMKMFTSAIMDCLVVPLQEKLEEWKKSVLTLDKDHAREFKKARSELKKRSTDTLRLQKKVGRKGVVGRNGDLQKAMLEVNEQKSLLEEVEKKALRAALIEERSRYCIFVTYLKPVVDEEVAMLSELSHLQEVMAQLEKHTADPYSLPAASEQVMADMKGVDSTWLLPSPTSSPGSIGSRKSSMCSISSINSSSSGSSKSYPSPIHTYWNRSFHQNPSCPRSDKPGAENNDDIDNTPPDEDKSGVTFVQSNTSTSTWPNLQDTLQFERAASAILNERPHTVSSAFAREGHHTPRPALSVHTFHNPQQTNASQPASPNKSNGSSIYARPPIPLRCSSLERPSVPATPKPSPNASDLRSSQIPYSHPTYVNMVDLANLAAKKAEEIKITSNEKDSSTSESSLESSSGYGSQTQNLDMENSIYNEGYPNSSSTLRLSSSLLRRSSMNLPKPPPPVRRTPSMTGSRLKSCEGSLENLPPPPAFLLTENILTGSVSELQKSVANSIASEIAKRNQELQYHRIMCSGSNEGSPKLGRHVFNTESSQQEPIYRSTNTEPIYRSTNTEPIYRSTNAEAICRSTKAESIYRSADADPIFRFTNNRSMHADRVYKSTSNADFQPIYRSTSSFSSDIKTQDSKVDLSSSVNVAETVRTLTELNHQPASPVALRRSSERQNLLVRLTPTMSRRKDSVTRASRVRQWISVRTSPDPKLCHDSLMEQIKRGAELRPTRAVNDRSAPRIR